jgi:hypothetical protein
LGNFTLQSNVGPLDNFGGDNYPGQTSLQPGIGGTTATASVTFADPNYFLLPVGSQFSVQLFNSSQVLPFAQVDPSARFLIGTIPGGTSFGAAPVLAGAGSGSLGVNGNPLTGTDVQFQVDGNASFQFIPEPTSLAVWALAMGTVGLVIGVSSRRRRD